MSSYEFLLEALQLTATSDSLKAAMALTNTWMSGTMLPVADEQLIIRSFHWFDSLLQTDPRLDTATSVLIEIMQNVNDRGGLTKNMAIRLTSYSLHSDPKGWVRLWLALYAESLYSLS